MKTYTELIQIPTYRERFEYLKLGDAVGQDTFGFDRYLNQAFYHSTLWKRIKNQVIVRDNGMEMGLDGYPITGKIFVHHMNPIDQDDVLQQRDILLNPEYLICVGSLMHNAIHYGSFDILPTGPVERTPNDMRPWKH